jgi:DNA-binding response OmpR family regulator
MTTVLIIEDEPPLTRMMAAHLLEAGFTVSTVDSAENALVRLVDVSPDIIVFNTFIPDDAKPLVIDQFRALVPLAKILDVSLEKNRIAGGYIAKPTNEQPPSSSLATDGSSPASASPADAYLQLPFDASVLVTAVRELAVLLEQTEREAAAEQGIESSNSPFSCTRRQFRHTRPTARTCH